MYAYESAQKRLVALDRLGLWLYAGLALVLGWSALCTVWVRPASLGVACGCLGEIYAAVVTLYFVSLAPRRLKEARDVFSTTAAESTISGMQLFDTFQEEISSAWKEAKAQFLSRLAAVDDSHVLSYRDLTAKLAELGKLKQAYQSGRRYEVQGKGTVQSRQNPAWGSTLTSLSNLIEVLREIHIEERRAAAQYSQELQLAVHFQLLIVVKAALLRSVQLKALASFLRAQEVPLRAHNIVIALDTTGAEDVSPHAKYARALQAISALSSEELEVFHRLRDEFVAEQDAARLKAKEQTRKEEEAVRKREGMLQERLERRLTVAPKLFQSSQEMPDGPQKFERIRAEFESSHSEFLDAQFPHSESSLGAGLSALVSLWSRPAPDSVVYRDKFNTLEIMQGQLGDCYFLSALSVLSQEQLKAVLVSGAERELGAFLVKFIRGGKDEYVIVDDYFPQDQAGEWAFARTVSGKELWPMVIEKAYAKLHGAYAHIAAGRVQYALSHLTGGAPEEIKLKAAQSNPAAFWTTLSRYHSHGYLLGAGSPEGGDAVVSRSGIVQGHAYALLAVEEVDGERLLQLRNPHGLHGAEWNGDWSDGSSKWTQRFRNRLQATEQDDGIFWMSLEDFVEEFRSLYICRIFGKEWTQLDEVKGRWEGASAAGLPSRANPAAVMGDNPQYLLSVTRPCSLFIQLSQDEGVDMFRGRLPILFMLFQGAKRVSRAGVGLVASSGSPTDLLTVSGEALLESGLNYVLLVATMNPGVTGGFSLRLTCEDDKARLTELR